MWAKQLSREFCFAFEQFTVILFKHGVFFSHCIDHYKATKFTLKNHWDIQTIFFTIYSDFKLLSWFSVVPLHSNISAKTRFDFNGS